MSRPAMHARDSSGRQISLLNDDSTSKNIVHYRAIVSSRQDDTIDGKRSNSYNSEASSPSTPGLLRSGSYDSQVTNNDPNSPLTPSALFEVGRHSSYTSSYPDPTPFDQRPDRHSMFATYPGQKTSSSSSSLDRPSYVDRNSSSFDDENANQKTPERAEKRYPCRFEDSHGCDKTFTTSGHASRHSKIHTAEKAVHCQFTGCQKKFTRADNMKQHLETHFKERSRLNASHKSCSSSTSKLTTSSGVKKTSSNGSRVSRPSSRTESRRPQLPPLSLSSSYTYPSSSTNSPVGSPTSNYGSLNMNMLQQGLPTPLESDLSSRAEMPPTGLDALAAAVACQARS